MPSEKQRLKRQTKRKETAVKKLEMDKAIKTKVAEAKRAREARRAELERYREAELMLIGYMFKAIHDRVPNSGEYLDDDQLKTLCERFIKEKPAVGYYEDVVKFAKKKIKQIDDIKKALKKAKK